MRTFLLLLMVSVLLASNARGQPAGLKRNFYKKSCPQAEQIVQNLTAQNVANNSALPAKLLRMFFHDCFVRGCDASVLIDSTRNNTAEKDAAPNKSLEGFEAIDKMKAAVENACPNTVSCADILALASRDAVSIQFKKSLWEVQTGRRDGAVSTSTEASANIPSPFSNFSVLVQDFSRKGLDLEDLVALSGGHTIGDGNCRFFSIRLYNFTGRGDTDPSMDATYATYLKTQCTSLLDNTTSVPMDPGSSTSFDAHYYANLKINQGLFMSDTALLTDKRSAKLVGSFSDQNIFLEAFKKSIQKMGRISVLTGTNGEVRKNCRMFNP